MRWRRHDVTGPAQELPGSAKFTCKIRLSATNVTTPLQASEQLPGPGQPRGRLWAQILLFGALSGIGTALHFGVLFATVEWAGLPAVTGSTLGAVCGMLFNYVAHYHLTFVSSAAHRRSLPLFLVGGAVSVVLNLLLMTMLLALDLNYLLAQLLATLLVFVFNFFYAKYVAFQS